MWLASAISLTPEKDYGDNTVAAISEVIPPP
jgi:hypothetical protein